MLVGGFNPFEKYQSKWESSPNRGENKTSLKPPTSITLVDFRIILVNMDSSKNCWCPADKFRRSLNDMTKSSEKIWATPRERFAGSEYSRFLWQIRG